MYVCAGIIWLGRAEKDFIGNQVERAGQYVAPTFPNFKERLIEKNRDFCSKEGCRKKIWFEPEKDYGGDHYFCERHETKKYRGLVESFYKNYKDSERIPDGRILPALPNL